MTAGTYLSDAELERLGVSRYFDRFGKKIYKVPCMVCGEPLTTRTFSTEKVYKCELCKKDIVAKRKAKTKAVKEQAERILAEDVGVDYEHFHRFEKAVAVFGPEYAKDIERARAAIEKFDSIPEVIACIELLHIGARVIAHQKVGGYTVDFCLPDDKMIIEIDGSIYHTDETRQQVRDYALVYMLGDGWEVRHVPADAVSKRHEAFGRAVRKMLDSRHKAERTARRLSR